MALSVAFIFVYLTHLLFYYLCRAGGQQKMETMPVEFSVTFANQFLYAVVKWRISFLIALLDHKIMLDRGNSRISTERNFHV